jgi:hypothetical protein
MRLRWRLGAGVFRTHCPTRGLWPRESVSVCYLAKVSGEHAFDDRADLSDHPAREYRINQQTVKNSRLPVSQIKPPVGFDHPEIVRHLAENAGALPSCEQGVEHSRADVVEELIICAVTRQILLPSVVSSSQERETPAKTTTIGLFKSAG